MLYNYLPTKEVVLVESTYNHRLLNWAISQVLVDFPHTNRTLAQRFFGWVFRHQTKRKNVMSVAELAIEKYDIEPQHAAGYRHVVAKYFAEPVDRYGKRVPKRRAK